MIASAYLSLTDYNIVTPPRFAGLSNYEFMFKDRLFWKSIENTLYYTIIFVPIAIAGSLGLAMLLNQNIAGRVALRTLYFLPSITPVVAAAFLWLWIFQPQIGLMNAIISALGLGDGPLWLGHPGSSKPALIIISLWGALGGNTMLIFLAALQGIPKELYESADIDGAGGVGLNIIMGAVMCGADPVIAIDTNSSKMEIAREFGATHTLYSDDNSVAEIQGLTGGRGADHVFESVGLSFLQERGLDATRPGGTLTLVGLTPVGSDTNLPGAIITRTEKVIRGSFYGSVNTNRDFPKFIELYRAGKLKLDELVTRRYQLDEINEAYANMLTGEVARGIIVF